MKISLKKCFFLSFLSGRSHANFQSLAGQTNIRNSAGNLIDINRVTEHPQYDDWTLKNDIVVCRLVSNMDLSGPTMRAAVLPPSGHLVPDGGEMFVTGWGTLQAGTQRFPDILQGVNIPKWTVAACAIAYPRETILDQHICGGAVGRDSCQGDSGGPVAYDGMQVGVVSWGYSCAAEWPGVNARVSYFVDWIRNEMNRA